MKIRDNETGEVFEYGTNMHHALRISENGGCLTFENLQNGDGSLKSGDGGYSFVLDDGKTPIESNSPDAVNGATYANIGGFYRSSTKSDGWIPVEEQLPEAGEKVLVWYEYFRYGEYNRMYETYGIGWQYFGHWSGDVSGTKAKCIAWSPLPELYRTERSINEKE